MVVDGMPCKDFLTLEGVLDASVIAFLHSRLSMSSSWSWWHHSHGNYRWQRSCHPKLLPKQQSVVPSSLKYSSHMFSMHSGVVRPPKKKRLRGKAVFYFDHGQPICRFFNYY